jgi:hypothetical protein
MKKLLPVFFLFCSSFSQLKAQYHPMVADTTKWCLHWNVILVRSAERFLEYNRFDAIGDTTMGSQVYKKIWTDGSTYFGAVREDSSLQRVYFIHVDDTTEQLLYDFSLNLGDTMVVDLQNNMSGNMYDGNYIVDSVSMVSIQGGLRKYLRLHNPLNVNLGPNGKPLDLEWIESVGDLHNTFYTYMYDNFGYGSGTFSCGTEQESEIFNNEQNGVRNYVNLCIVSSPGGYMHSDTCTIDYAGAVHELNAPLVKTIVYPNPSNGQNLNLDVNGFTGNELAMVISDISGKTVWTGKQVRVVAQTVIFNPNLNNGVYVLHTYDSGRKISQTRFVVAK